MQGMLLIDKPKGWTSFDVVNKVRRMAQDAGLNTTGRKRYPVGHTGTLDPLATGLLVLLLGAATKHAPALTKLDKTYEVTMRLGQTSTTGDEEGDKIEVSSEQPGQTALAHTLQQFVGDSMQTPPAFSAVKINGQRAYKLAREGRAPELKPRPVTIHAIELTGYAYPYATFTAHVSSGTYIRSLVADVGQVLGTGAYMSDLRRTRVGDFAIDKAVTMPTLTPAVIRTAVQSEA